MNNIKRIRKEQGISVTELASKLDMSQSNLTKIENGQIELKTETAEKIAAALSVSPLALQETPQSSNGVHTLEVLNPATLNLPPLARLPLPTHMVSDLSENAVLFAQADDTMSPNIPSGSLIIIDKSIKNASDGVYAVKIGQNIILRRLQHTFSATVNILCDNPLYPPQQIDIASINIIGKAVLSFSFKSL